MSQPTIIGDYVRCCWWLLLLLLVVVVLDEPSMPRGVHTVVFFSRSRLRGRRFSH